MTTLLGITLIAVALIAVETALGLVFDGRWRDFPFAALTIAVVPFTTLALLTHHPRSGVRPIAEVVFAGLLALAAVYIGFNEGAANWQSLWTCAIYLLLGFTLLQARENKSSESKSSESQSECWSNEASGQLP
jgi:MFS superfamily sulfate permease-like transporter